MIILALVVTPHLENDRAQASSALSDRAELLRIIALLVEQERLVKDLLRVYKVDAVFLLDNAALSGIRFEAHGLYKSISRRARDCARAKWLGRRPNASSPVILVA